MGYTFTISSPLPLVPRPPSLSRIWSVNDRQVLMKVNTPHPVRSVAFSPTDDQLAAGMQNGEFIVFNTKYV